MSAVILFAARNGVMGMAPRSDAKQRMVRAAEQLIRERGYPATAISDSVAHTDGAAGQADSAAGLIGAYLDLGRDGMVASGYSRGCGIAPLVTEATPDEPDDLGAVGGRGFAAMADRLAFHFVEFGLDRTSASQLADAVLAGVEGALITARARRSPAPFDAVKAALTSYAATLTPKTPPRRPR